TQLIARRVRELHVYCEIHPFDLPLDALPRLAPVGIILSGGPASVYAEGAPLPARDVLELLMTGAPPVLGICYGMNVLGQAFGGEVKRAARGQTGRGAASPKRGCRASASGWGPGASSAGSRGASIRRWPPRSSTAPSASGSPASSSTTASCAPARRSRCCGCSATPWSST